MKHVEFELTMNNQNELGGKELDVWIESSRERQGWVIDRLGSLFLKDEL